MPRGVAPLPRSAPRRDLSRAMRNLCLVLATPSAAPVASLSVPDTANRTVMSIGSVRDRDATDVGLQRSSFLAVAGRIRCAQRV